MWFALILACGGPEPEPAETPEETAPAPSVDTLVWVDGRDAAGRFTIEWPTEPGGPEALPRELDGTKVLQYTTTAATEEQPLVKARVGWVLVERGDGERADEAWLQAGVELASGPEDAETTTLGGLPARQWTSSNYSTQFTSAVVLGPDRLYVVRATHVSKERDEALHTRILDSFHPLSIDELAEEERSATDDFVAMVQANRAAEADRAAGLAEAEAAKAAAIAAGERPADEMLVREHAMRQAIGMLCSTGGDSAATLRLSVSGGEVTSARVFEVIRSFSNNQPAPRERDDQLASCVKQYATRWTFPDDVSASGVEVPLWFGPM
jgi:hypothetical protein